MSFLLFTSPPGGAIPRDLTDSPRQFELNVRRSMQGGYVAGQSFSNVMR